MVESVSCALESAAIPKRILTGYNIVGNLGFQTRSANRSIQSPIMEKDYNVIVNIYANPELLS